jgi:hypothetical protein
VLPEDLFASVFGQSAKEVNPMKRVLLTLALLGLGVGMASAQQTDLTGGTFIAHHDPAMVASVPQEGYCQQYLDGFAIEVCEDANPTIDTTAPVVWFLLSAFPGGDKEWCGTEFGFGDFDPYNFVFTGFGPCTPGGNLEIPTDFWPGPNEGTAIVTTDTPWFGNLLPVYYFEGYAYYYLPAVIPVGVDPPTGFGGWGNCLTPPEDFDAAAYPTVGLLMMGENTCPEEPQFVCCVGEECILVDDEQGCMDLGGDYYPDLTSCEPNPCLPPPMGACCVGEECYYVTREECDEMQGIYQGDDTDCGPPNPCEYERFVCCVCEDCYIATEDECEALDGEFHPEWDSCDPNPCPASPADNTSWGTIKSIYR